jgi:hypothetical protein
MEHFYDKIDGFSTMEDQGELIKFLLNNFDNKKTIRLLEIGVYKGRCTAMWNVELINNNFSYEYYAVDHFEGSSEHLKDIDYYKITLDNLGLIMDNIKLIKNESINESLNYPDEFFDIIYIDASHEYTDVKNDIIAWRPKVKQNGFICGDDYISGWPGVMMAVNEIFDNKINKIGYQQWWIQKN